MHGGLLSVKIIAQCGYHSLISISWSFQKSQRESQARARFPLPQKFFKKFDRTIYIPPECPKQQLSVFLFSKEHQ